MKLLLADCLESLPTLPPHSVDMVLADLPYGTTQNEWDSVIPLDRLWPLYWRVCKPNAAIVLFAQTPFDKVLGMSNLRYLKYEWIWEKTEATGHLNSKKCPMKAHENVLVFYFKAPVYNPQKTAGHPRKTARAVAAKASSNYGAQGDRGYYDSTDRYPRDVVTFPTDKQRSKLHPTQKPVALCEYLIRTYTDEGALVLDNCMGSGTTGVAALNSGRNFVGIEKDPAFFEIAQTRIAEAAGKAAA